SSSTLPWSPSWYWVRESCAPLVTQIDAPCSPPSRSLGPQRSTMGLQQLGPYRIIRPLGEGGMGCVYEAVHETLGRRVAIKVLHADHAATPSAIARFFNEARAVNIVQHPSLVSVSEFGQAEDGTAYMVMEYLEGESLAARILRCGRLPDGMP